MRVLVAGAGAFGREHLRRFAGHDLDLFVADPRIDAARTAAETYGCREAGDDAVPMMDRLRPAALVVATPAPSHLPLTTHALRLGIPVLLEKPVAMTANDARRLVALEQDSAAFVLPGHVLRFSAAHRRLAEIIHGGEIGEPVSITSRRYRDVDHVSRYPDTDQVLMTMIHDIDLALWFGRSKPVSAQAVRRHGPEGGTATDAAVCDSEGIHWHLSTAWTFPADSLPADRVEVLGTKGSVELEVGSELRLSGAMRWRTSLQSTDDDPLATEIASFLQCVQAGRNVAGVSLDDAVEGLVAAQMILDFLSRPAVSDDPDHVG